MTPSAVPERFSASLWKLLWLSGIAASVDLRRTVEGLGWWIRGKRLRGYNILRSAASRSPAYYRFWIRTVERRLDRELATTSEATAPPKLAVIIISSPGVGHIAAHQPITSISASLGHLPLILTGQVALPMEWPAAHIAVEGADMATILRFCEAEGIDYVIPIFAGDEIAPLTGEILCSVISRNMHVEILYWDEDSIDERNTRTDPWLKSDWNYLHFLSQDFLTGSCMFSVGILRRSENAEFEPSALAAELVHRANRPPHHVPAILSHRRHLETPISQSERLVPLRSLVAPGLIISPGAFGVSRLSAPLPSPAPSVSILVPTRNRLDLLKTCIEGLFSLDYPGEIEIAVIDNDSDDAATLAYFATLKERGVRIIPVSGAFNFSLLNNRGVEETGGDYLCLLNNDIEMLDGQWLGELVGHACRPGVGAVGTRLIYPDGSLQHGGVVVGLGAAAGHVEKALPSGQPGYFSQSHVTRQMTAVTAACLVVSRQAYLAVGGLDEQRFAVAFNDVDFCLKLDAAGYRNIYVGHATLIHHESKSRGSDMSQENSSRFLKELTALRGKWGTNIYQDPFFHRRLSTSSEQIFLEI